MRQPTLVHPRLRKNAVQKATIQILILLIQYGLDINHWYTHGPRPAVTHLITLDAIFNRPLCIRLIAAKTLHCAARIGFPNLIATKN